MTPETWVMTRDHSWGLRPTVGAPVTDLQPDPMDSHPPRVLAVWNPVLFTRDDGQQYGFHTVRPALCRRGLASRKVQGGFEFADGRREPVERIEPRLRASTPSTSASSGGSFR